MPVTIKEVALKLGLSIAAVSRALDGYPDISAETRLRVLETAREMGYVPNRAARQLRRQKADAVGFILPSALPRFADPFYAEFLVGLSDETARHPFDLLISIAPPGDDAERNIYEAWVQTRKVDGFILNRIRHNDWRASYLDQHAIPFAALELSQEGLDYPRIEVDNAGGMIALVEHLAESGYRRMAFVGGPQDLISQTNRLAGFIKGLETMSLPYDPALFLQGDLTSDGGYQAVQALRTLPVQPDAIVCINDETAIGVLHALDEMGLIAGQDIGVTGFEGVQVSQHTHPPLTTLDIPVTDIARRLVQMLAAVLDHQPLAERRVVIQPRLLVRQSTSRGRKS